MISRNEGYRLSAGKEEPSLVVAADFFESVIGVTVKRITDPQEHYELGDFRAPSGVTIECKSQPIDPARYKQNFVEVFEVTQKELHRDGIIVIADLLAIDPSLLERIPVRIKGRGVPTPLMIFAEYPAARSGAGPSQSLLSCGKRSARYYTKIFR